MDTFPIRYEQTPQPRLLHQELEQHPRKRNAVEGRMQHTWAGKAMIFPTLAEWKIR